MTTPVATSRSNYAGNGVTTVFDTGFYFLEQEHVVVKHTPSGGSETVLTLGVHYTVTMPLTIGAAGSVTMLAAPGAGDVLVIERTVPYTQDTSFRTQGAFSPEIHEDSFDYARHVDQQLARRVSDLESAGAAGSVVAGNGLSFSGATLHVGAGNGVQANADTVEVLYGAAGAMAAVTKAAAVAGVANTAARIDHKHDVSTAAPTAGAVLIGNAAAEGVATSLARSDHVHELAAPAAPANVTKAAAATGASTAPARADHKHDVSTGVAVDLTDAANAEGGAATLARSDHTHAHGARGGGNLHAVAVAGGAAGFLSGTDAAMLARLADLAHVKAFANAAQSWAAGAGSSIVQFNDDGGGAVGPLLWDNGADFDTATFKFTAPRTGFYLVCCNMRLAPNGGGNWTAGDAFSFSLYKNGVTPLWEAADITAWAALNNSLSIAWATTVYLAASDTLEVRGAATGATSWKVGKGYLSIDEMVD